MPGAVTPFLMFEGQAEEALNLYVEAIPDSKILDIQRYGADGPGGPDAENSVMLAAVSLRGQTVMLSDSYVQHDFTFTPAISLFVTCESDEEIVRISTALIDGGEALMPLDNYGFSRRFTWVQDRFGVSWQLNLP